MVLVFHLMGLFMLALNREAKALAKNNVQLKVVGDLSSFSEKLQSKIKDVEALTGHCTGLKLIVAANYGGRWEILQACRQIATQVQQGKLAVEEIDESLFASHLYTAGICDPDLLIRTSGEMRVSNFLLWQVAYAELYVTDTLWPDFDRAELHQALQNYQKRHRRFGRI